MVMLVLAMGELERTCGLRCGSELGPPPANLFSSALSGALLYTTVGDCSQCRWLPLPLLLQLRELIEASLELEEEFEELLEENPIPSGTRIQCLRPEISSNFGQAS